MIFLWDVFFHGTRDSNWQQPTTIFGVEKRTSLSACCPTTAENDFSVGRFLPWNEVLQLTTTEKRFRRRKLYSSPRKHRWWPPWSQLEIQYYTCFSILCAIHWKYIEISFTKHRSATCCSSRFETGTFTFKVRSSTGRPLRLSDDDNEAMITIWY